MLTINAPLGASSSSGAKDRFLRMQPSSSLKQCRFCLKKIRKRILIWKISMKLMKNMKNFDNSTDDSKNQTEISRKISWQLRGNFFRFVATSWQLLPPNSKNWLQNLQTVFAERNPETLENTGKNPEALRLPGFLFWCGKWDLNPHVLTNTGTSSLPVCLFQHSRSSLVIISNSQRMSTVFCRGFEIPHMRIR